MAENLIKLIKRNLPLLASLGGFLLGYSNGIIGSALLFIKPIFQLSDFSAGLIASIVIIGTMLGIIIASGLTDRWGRRFFISISSLIFMLGFVMSAFAVNSHILLCGRFLAGIGIGIALVVVPLYLVEMAPTKWRGAYIATFQLAITLGSFTGCAFSFWLAHYAAWRWMFGCGVVWALCLFMSSLFLPAVSKLPEKKLPESIVSVKMADIFQSRFYRPFLIGIGISILQQITGINAIMYFAPQILQSTNNPSNLDAIFSALILMGSNFIFTIVSLFVLDFIGRRPVLIFSLLTQFIALAALGILSKWQFDNAQIYFVTALMIYVFGYAVGLGPAGWLIISEIYPAQIRSKAIGITIMINNIAAFIVSVTFLDLLRWLTKSNTFWIYSFISLLGILFIIFIVPETKRKSLEEIERMSL